MKLTIIPAKLNDIGIILDFMDDYYKIEGIEFNRAKSKRTLEDFITNGNLGSLCLINFSDEQLAIFVWHIVLPSKIMEKIAF